nr:MULTISPECIES: hypothetical protein [Nostoc]
MQAKRRILRRRMEKKESNKQSKFNKNNQGLTSGAPTARVSKNIFGAGSIIQELRNRFVKLANNASHDKSFFGLKNMYETRIIMIPKSTISPPML